MQNIIIFSAILATAFAAPGNLIYNSYVPLAKSTLTTSSQSVDHGSTHVLQPVYMPVQYHVPLAKTTTTDSKHVVDHGSTHVVHAPVVHAPLVQSSVASVYHAPVYHTSPLVSYKTPDSAVSHHSSTVHETVPVVNSYPLYTLHH